jgi:hypothetical protein
MWKSRRNRQDELKRKRFESTNTYCHTLDRPSDLIFILGSREVCLQVTGFKKNHWMTSTREISVLYLCTPKQPLAFEDRPMRKWFSPLQWLTFNQLRKILIVCLRAFRQKIAVIVSYFQLPYRWRQVPCIYLRSCCTFLSYQGISIDDFDYWTNKKIDRIVFSLLERFPEWQGKPDKNAPWTATSTVRNTSRRNSLRETVR